MMNNWGKVKLGDVCEILSGGTPKTKNLEYWNGDIQWLSIADFNNVNRTVFTTEKTITTLGFQNCSSNMLRIGDIIISARGTVGALAQLGKEMAFNQSCYGLRAKISTTKDFLYYAVRNIVAQIKLNTHGSVFDTITKETFNVLEIDLPPLEEQKVIADVLSALDDKIELNNKINKNLEEQAQAIFKRWFVDFEFPDENGNPYKSSGGEMTYSELGEIPKGWEVSTIEKHVQNIDNRGKTPPLSSDSTEYPIIDVKALSGDNRIINFKNCTKFVDETVFNSFFRCGHPKELDILISTVGSLAETKLFYGNKGCIAQNVIGFRSIDISPFYLFELLRFFKNDLIAFDIGTVQPSIKVTQFNKYKIILPSKKMLNDFDNLINSLSQRIYNNEQENQKLVELRNYLLPKLMSGEIKILMEETNGAVN